MVKMRIPIREQLGALVLISSLIGVAVVAIATWTTNRTFVLAVRSTGLALTASLKAAQVNANLVLMRSAVRSTSTRLLLQNALKGYNQNSNNTEQKINWVQTVQDLQSALTSLAGGIGYQAALLPRNDIGTAGPRRLVNTTIPGILGHVKLPGKYSDGSDVHLGDNTTEGYPSRLYPNFTYTETPINSMYTEWVAHYGGQRFDENSNGLFLGPWFINETNSLVSITLPVINNTSVVDLLGWITVVMSGELISEVAASPQGLESTGVLLLLGPDNTTNHFAPGVINSENTGHAPDNVSVRFVLPAKNTYDRHPAHGIITFSYSQYPVVKSVITENQMSIDNAGSSLQTHNEEGMDVSVGYAVVSNPLVDWVVIVEQTHSEVWAPINHLRNILLACVFGTAGAMFLVAFPVAHYSSRPIRRLRDAAKKSITPPGYSDDDDSLLSRSSGEEDDAVMEARKEGFIGALARLRGFGRLSPPERREVVRRREFRIPSKVTEQKHIVQDELTELTSTFNEMTDELMMQYTKLEERVEQRTAELELSKKAAEAANKSKTLFIANLSHELKTPLNGIMGMCAVSMGEPDPVRVQNSLGTIYKSGELLLNLLTDLLDFSRNQMQQLALDEREFKLRDVSQQVLSIFERQATESKISLSFRFDGPPDLKGFDMIDSKWKRDGDMGPPGTGRVKDMILWGDPHRILQVVINLVSNSLKFTPPGGSVTAVARCVREVRGKDMVSFHSSRKGSANSNAGRKPSPRTSRSHVPSNASMTSSMLPPNLNTALEINPMEKPLPSVSVSERAASPVGARTLLFEFEVTDTGPGIPEAQQQRIFEPFEQGDLGLSKKYGGTGLGLSICSQLATLMRGNISLTSEIGHGSTFTMEIPLRYINTHTDSKSSSIAGAGSQHRSFSEARPSAPDVIGGAGSIAPSTVSSPMLHEGDGKPRLLGLKSPFFASPMLSAEDTTNSALVAMEKAAAEAGASGEKLRVLVAEDNKTNQEVVLRMLKLEDICYVTIAQDGQEAYDLVRESMLAKPPRPYNLIFMDVQMPNLNGLDSTRLIRQTGFSAPIVALSAYSEDSNVKECIESGMNDFISKPIRRPRLKQVLKNYCSPIPEAEDGGALSGHAAKTDARKNPPVAAKGDAKGKARAPDTTQESSSRPTSESPAFFSSADASASADPCSGSCSPVSPLS